MSVGRVISGKLAVRDGRLACDCCFGVGCEGEIFEDPFAFGACCKGNSCYTTHRCLCEQANGTFLGQGTSCATARCDRTGPDGEGGPNDPLVCVHYYESVITCNGGQETNGPVGRAGSQCEQCSSTNYPANNPINVNEGWVRESRWDGSAWIDYWVYKYCSGDTCGSHLDCQLQGPDPSEFGFNFPLPPTPPIQQGAPDPNSYCAQFGLLGPTLGAYSPQFPNGPDGLPGVLARSKGCSDCEEELIV